MDILAISGSLRSGASKTALLEAARLRDTVSTLAAAALADSDGTSGWTTEADGP